MCVKYIQLIIVLGMIKDPSGQPIYIKNLKLDFRDLQRDGFLKSNVLQMPLKQLAKQAIPRIPSGPKSSTEDMPWYDMYRNQFFHLLEPSHHEFFRHYIACNKHKYIPLL